MITEERRDALREKHARLESKIEQENQRPHPDDMRLVQWKGKSSALKRKWKAYAADRR